MSGFTEPRTQTFDAPMMDKSRNQLYNQRAPQMEVPGMDTTQKSMQDMQRLVGQQGPNLERQMFGMMMGGPGSPQQNIAQQAQRQGDDQRQRMINQAMSSGVPLQSSAMGRSMADAASQQDLDRNMQMAMLDAQMRNQGMQGMTQQLPQFMSQPAGLEQMFVQGRQPFQLANQQAQMQQQQAINDFLTQQAFYQPERVQGPSIAQQIFDPLATIAGKALGSYMGTGG